MWESPQEQQRAAGPLTIVKSVPHLTPPHCDSIEHFTFVYTSTAESDTMFVHAGVHFKKGFILFLTLYVCVCVCVYVFMCLLGYMQGTASITPGGQKRALNFMEVESRGCEPPGIVLGTELRSCKSSSALNRWAPPRFWLFNLLPVFYYLWPTELFLNFVR